MLKKETKWIEDITTVFCITIIVLTVLHAIIRIIDPGQASSVGGYRLMPVLTGSMQPVFMAGDMIITGKTPRDEIKIGDIIAYRTGEDILSAHRVVDIVDEQGKKVFRTKGDANNTGDSELLDFNRIVGVYALRIPYGGYIAGFIRTWTGVILLLIILLVFLTLPALRR